MSKPKIRATTLDISGTDRYSIIKSAMSRYNTAMEHLLKTVILINLKIINSIMTKSNFITSVVLIISVLIISCKSDSKSNTNEALVSSESLKNETEKYKFERIKDSVTHTCYYYKSEFPKIKVSESNNPSIEYINNLIRDCSFRIPAIMSNENYKNFRKCKQGSYNNQKSLHDLHVTNQDCEWCKSEFYSEVLVIEQKKYLSILMQVEYTSGGNWGSVGYNSLLLKNDEVITIPNNESVKKTLIEDIKEYQSKNKLVDIDGNNYSLFNEINNWDIDDLTFYFKNDSLMLIFNGGYYVQNQNFDIPLPKLQLLLTL